MPLPSPAFRMSAPSPLRHRGFELAVRREGEGAPLSFRVSHRGLALHTSRPDFQTAVSAERAARQFVDDALGAFRAASSSLAA